MNSTNPDSDGGDADAIADALSLLRGRMRPGRPGERGPGGPFGPGMRGRPGPRGIGGHRALPGAGGIGPHPHGAPARFRLLEALSSADQPLTVSEVGEAIGVDQPRASRLIQQGVDLGLVERQPDAADARRTRIALADAGRAMLRGFRRNRREELTAALADFTDAERSELVRLLGKLAAGWPSEDGRGRRGGR